MQLSTRLPACLSLGLARPASPFPLRLLGETRSALPYLVVSRRLWVRPTRGQAWLGTEDSDDGLVAFPSCQSHTPKAFAGVWDVLCQGVPSRYATTPTPRPSAQ